MAKKQRTALVLVLIPITILVLGILLSIGFGVWHDLSPDPYDSFEDGRELFALFALAAFSYAAVPLAVIALVILGGERQRFAKPAAITELIIAVPVVLLTGRMVLRMIFGIG